MGYNWWVKDVLVLAMRSGSAPKMPFLNIFVIFCVCIHTLPIQIVTFRQFEIRTLKNDIFFLRKIGGTCASWDLWVGVWRGTASHLSLVVFAWIESLMLSEWTQNAPKGSVCVPRFCQKNSGHFCKSVPRPKKMPSWDFQACGYSLSDRLQQKKSQWGVAIFAKVQGSRSCVAQPHEVVIVVYSA